MSWLKTGRWAQICVDTGWDTTIHFLYPTNICCELNMCCVLIMLNVNLCLPEMFGPEQL